MNVITRGIRNAFRNSVRTLSIITILGLSIGLALAMVVARQAVSQKIASVKESVGNTITISPAGFRGFQGGGNPLTETQLTKVKSLVHVTGINESIGDRLTTSDTNLQSSISAGSLGRRFGGNGGGQANGLPGNTSNTAQRTFTPPVTVTGTTDPTQLSSLQGGGTFTLKSGTAFGSTSTAHVALVGSDLATKNDLKVGSTFTAYNTAITVVGIFDAGNTFANSQLIMPLATVQSLSGQAGDITSATVTVDSVGNVTSTTSAIEKMLGSSADVTSDASRIQQSLAPLKNVQTISLYSLIGAVIAGAAILFLTMVMIVRERRREIGVLKAVGASNIRIMSQFMAEATTLTILGAIIGIIIGAVGGNPITHTLVTNSASTTTATSATFGSGGGNGQGHRFGGGFFHNAISNQLGLTDIHAAIGWSIMAYGLLAAVAIAVIGSALASLLIARVRPAEVMRVE